MLTFSAVLGLNIDILLDFFAKTLRGNTNHGPNPCQAGPNLEDWWGGDRVTCSGALPPFLFIAGGSGRG